MITVKEALSRVKLSDQETTDVQRLEAVFTEEIRKALDKAAASGGGYDGRPVDITLKTKASLKKFLALKRRFEAGGWRLTYEQTTDAYGEEDGYTIWFEAAGAPPVPPSTGKATVEKPNVDVQAEVLRLLSSPTQAVAPLVPSPTLSVILGTYNRFSLLKAAVQSIRSSVGPMAYEIIVCDGGSTDGSRAWLAEQPDVVLIGDRHLTGAVVAFNHCFRLCRGEFVANLNDDCVVEGRALYEGVQHLKTHPKAGQVAFSFRGDAEEWHINDVYDGYGLAWSTTYANFGIIRKSVADTVAAITGGFWSPVYRTYAADCELSAWVHKLGHTVDKLPHLRVVDVRTDDDLRTKNTVNSGLEAKRMYARWPADAFRPDGCDPRVSPEELRRFRLATEGRLTVSDAASGTVAATDMVAEAASMVGFPEPQEERRIRALAPVIRTLDPVEGRFPKRAEHNGKEKVLHVHLGTDADPQDGLVRALKGMGENGGGYRQVRWPDFGHEERQKKIIEAAQGATLVFLQLQTKNAVDVETIRKVREVADKNVVILTWNGDVASENVAGNVDAYAAFNRVVDVPFHSSLTHVRAMRAAGMEHAALLQIGYDSLDYCPSDEVREAYVAFLGSRYAGNDDFSGSLKHHDGSLRDAVVAGMRSLFRDKFTLHGSGWTSSEFLNHTEECPRRVYDDAVESREGYDPPACTCSPPAVTPVALKDAHLVLQGAEIGLNVSLLNNLDCYSSDRIFRILGCGALLLTKRFPMLSVLGLKHGDNCLVWETPEEALEMASAYLACRAAGDNGKINGRAAREIAEDGQRLAAEHHEWSVRVKEMQAYVDAVRSVRAK